jgi:hypothetical protein
MERGPNVDSLKASEELSAKGATHPRVSLDDINAAIASEHVFTAGEAVAALAFSPSDARTDLGSPLSLLTICILVLHNGFTVIGKSAPASPENFDAAKGATFAREDAIRQVWPLMGFALRDRLHREQDDAQAAYAAARRSQLLAVGHMGNVATPAAQGADLEWVQREKVQFRMNQRAGALHGALQVTEPLNLKSAAAIVAAAAVFEKFIIGPDET